MHTGRMISTAIKAEKMTVTELAVKMGVSKQRASMICSMPLVSVTTLERVSEAVDMPLWTLIKKYGAV